MTRGAWLTPDTTGTGRFIARLLFIPDDLDFLAAVTGCLTELTETFNWEQFGAQTPEDTAQAAFEMLQRYLKGDGGVIGSIFLWAGDTIPEHALECDGSTHGRTDFPSLYDVLGSVYHVDGDTLILPDLRGRVPIGAGSGPGLSSRTMGATGGLEGVALSGNEMPTHSHSEITAVATVINGGVEAPAAAALPGVGSTGLAGLGQSHENMPPWLALRWCIWAT